MKEKFISCLLLSTSLFVFNACSPSKVTVSEGGFYHSDIYFGKNFSSSYKKGIKDGCTTSKGNYKKSHTLFNNNSDYNNGWFLGRSRCRKLLVIVEEK
jgi:hypothetical protein